MYKGGPYRLLICLGCSGTQITNSVIPNVFLVVISLLTRVPTRFLHS